MDASSEVSAKTTDSGMSDAEQARKWERHFANLLIEHKAVIAVLAEVRTERDKLRDLVLVLAGRADKAERELAAISTAVKIDSAVE